SLNRAVVGVLERALVFEVKGGARVFSQAAVEREAHRRILGVALRGERLVVRVRELGNAQRVVQLKRDDIEVFERRDLDGGARGELVRLRQQLDVDLVVVRAQPRLLRRQR